MIEWHCRLQPLRHCRLQPHTARNFDSGIISQRIYDSKADTMWTTALT